MFTSIKEAVASAEKFNRGSIVPNILMRVTVDGRTDKGHLTTFKNDTYRLQCKGGGQLLFCEEQGMVTVNAKGARVYIEGAPYCSGELNFVPADFHQLENINKYVFGG